MSLMGVDIGTTGCKAIVFRMDGEVIGQGYREYPLLQGQNPGWMELNPQAVWNGVQSAIQEAVARAGNGDPVTAISFSSQGEACTPIDDRGNFLGNSIVTFDNRTIEQAAFFENKLGAERIFQITGMPLHPMHTINKILWWRENRPEVFGKASKFLCWADMAIYKLGGRAAIDYSLAGRTMAFDVHEERWSDKILGVAGIEESLFPEALPSGTVVAPITHEMAESLGLPEKVMLVTGAHDQPAGALGAGVIESGVAMDATGTVECITPAFDHLVLTDDMRRNSYCCYHHAYPGLYCTLSFNFTGGSLLRWYRDNFGRTEIEEAQISGLDVYDVLLGKASSGPSPILVLPHFTITGTPWFDPQSKGAILGLTLGHTHNDLVKALLDGVTYEMRLNLDYLEKSGVAIHHLRAIGGGAKSRVWMQLKADIFNRPVSSLNVSEAACLGVAMLAGAATNIYHDLKEAVSHLVKIKETYEPQPELAARYAERYSLYCEMYPLLRDFLHKC